MLVASTLTLAPAQDDTDWKRVGPKAGQTFMVVGTAGELPKPPAKPVVFLEDLGDQDLAEALKLPAGFKKCAPCPACARRPR